MDLNTFLTLYKNLLPWNLSRQKCFFQMVCGLVISGSVQQHKCALGFYGEAQQSSVCRRIRNFLSNFHFSYHDIARALVAICRINGPMELALDRTNWKFGRLDINLLVLSVALSDTFSMPLFWKALPKQGNSNSGERIDLLETFDQVFGFARIGALIGDREFIGEKWFRFLTKAKIAFFIRVKGNHLVEWGDHRRNISKFFNHLKVGQKRHIQFPHRANTLYYSGTRSSDGELVIVMSNQDLGNDILRIYANRWKIELMFRHCKTNGFNLEDTHLTDIKRVEKLFGVLACALAIAFLVGIREEREKPTQYKRTVHSPAYSTFRRGFDALRRILVQTKEIALLLLVNLMPPPLDSTVYTGGKKIVR